MVTGPPKRSRGQRKRELIRRAAYECFRDLGYHDTSVDAICQQAGISKGSLYWHYASKQDIFIDILEEWARQVIDELHDQFEATLRRRDYIQGITEALEREARRGRAIVPLWLEFTVHARREPEIRSALSKFYRRARTAIVEMLRPATGDALTDAQLEGVAGAVFGAYAGVMMQDLSDPESADASTAFRQVMPVLGEVLTHFGQLAQTARAAPRDRRVAVTRAAPLPSDRIDEERLRGFAGSFPPPVQRRLEAVRAIVLEAAPQANEKLITGWKSIGYEAGRLFCTLKPRHDDVLVGFIMGNALRDPAGLLTGTGKRKRHVAIGTADDIPEADLIALFKESAELADLD